ncbi:hypothetical protein KO488_11950 [Poseidonibacter lekithochrous]|uniref:hypothetical protein n=1 Tax=Poseidonibacter TaxID=2321187 RepID=UPI001C09EED8|nr:MULTISPECIES: hypothetical protein [Poseidonibacter]MBU3015471.1 hypothetical protein [Poseidonibacter lekithochrous]MDO6828770.1 hypothetical protein [Poseidonibacter sp. 1_MG-2023]
MKKLTLKVLTSITLLSSGFLSANASDYSKIDVEKVCNVKTNGIENVIETAKKYNNIAIKEGLEFRRLTVNNSGLIASVEEAIKTKAKEVNPKDFKGKASKTKLETNFAAHRSCKFAIRALQQAQEAKSTWRLAIPGDGYSY